MRFSFDNGVFEIILGKDDPIDYDFNLPGNVILRETEPGTFTVVKPLGEVLPNE